MEMRKVMQFRGSENEEWREYNDSPDYNIDNFEVGKIYNYQYRVMEVETECQKND